MNGHFLRDLYSEWSSESLRILIHPVLKVRLFMEIERKFTIKTLPDHLDNYPVRIIEQGYLCTEPVLRIRRDNDDYYFTLKGRGMMERLEENMPISAETYAHLLTKIDGALIQKKRYMIPLDAPSFKEGYTPSEDLALVIELDIFTSPKPLIMAEVEFPDSECANAFIAPDWFDEDVTMDRRYHNSNMV